MTDHVNVQKAKDALDRIISGRSRARDYFSAGFILPNPDPILKAQGKDITVYKDLTTDGHLFACMDSREAAVKGQQYRIEQNDADSKRHDLILDIFDNINMDQLITDIMWGRHLGYQPIEIMYLKDNYWYPESLIAKPQEWFAFGESNELRFLSKEAGLNGEELPAYKFLLAQNNATYMNPYGVGLLSKCFWPIAFKKGGVRFWLKFVEKYGTPFLHGKTPRGTQVEEQEQFLSNLQAAVQDAVMITYDDESVALLDTSTKGASSDLFMGLGTFMEAQISKAYLGHPGNTDSTSGKLGSEDSAMAVREDRTFADMKLVSHVANTLIDYIEIINFGNTTKMSFKMYSKESVDTEQADRDHKLSQTGQIRFTKHYFMRTYGFSDEDIAIVEPTNAVALADPPPLKDGSLEDDLNAALADDQLQDQAIEALRPVFELMEQSAGYPELMEKIAGIYPDMNTDQLQETLAKVIFINELQGRIDADGDALD
jgi:phage gp29-like protein